MQPQTPHAHPHPHPHPHAHANANPSPQHLAAAAAAAARHNGQRPLGPALSREGYGPPQGQGQGRVMMVNGNVPNFGAAPAPAHQNGGTIIHTSDPMHPQHASWRASIEQQQHQHHQQQQQQQVHYLRGQPGQPPLRVQTVFTGQHAQHAQGGPPNGMLPSPLPLNLPPNSRGPPSQNPVPLPQQPPPGARPLPIPIQNHPGAHPGGPPMPMPYRQQTGPPPPAPSSGPPTPLPMRQPSAPPPPNGPPPPVDPRVAAQLALSGIGPITASPSPVGPALAKLTALYDSLHRALELVDIEPLRQTVADFFTETGILKYALYDKTAALSKIFEIPCAAFPRFQHINAICGVLHSAVSPALVSEYFLTTPDPSSGRPAHVGYLLQADDTTWTSTFANGARVDLCGSLTVHFIVTLVGLRVESIEFNSRGHDEFVGRDSIAMERVERVYERRIDDEERERFERDEEERQREEEGEGRKRDKEKARKPGASTRRRSATKDSEEAADDAKERQPRPGSLLAQPAPGLGTITFDNHLLPISPVGSFGITEMGMRCLEIAESVAQLQDLIGYSLDHNLGPIQALASFSAHRPPHPSSSASAPLASSSQNPSTNQFYSSESRPGPGSPKRKTATPEEQQQSDYSAISVSPPKMARGAASNAARGRGRGQRGMSSG